MYSTYTVLRLVSSCASSLPLEDQKKVLQFYLWTLEQERDWKRDVMFAHAKRLATTMELKLGDFMYPIFIAIAGTSNSWSVMESMEFIGPDLTRARLREALNTLGGFSKKGMKKVEKEFAAFSAT